MKRFGLPFMAIVLTGCFPHLGKAQLVLDTTTSWNFFNGIGAIGEDFIFPTSGQTFTAPLGTTTIQSFTFWLNDRLNPGFVDFSAHLVQWDGTKPTGPLLFSSAPLSTTDNHGLGGMEKFQFYLPSVAVEPGQEYMAFLTTLEIADGLTGTAYVGVLGSDVMTGGRAYNTRSTDISSTLQRDWGFVQPSVDFAFRAEFIAVPEPSPIALAVCGLLTLAAFRARATTQRND